MASAINIQGIVIERTKDSLKDLRDAGSKLNLTDDEQKEVEITLGYRDENGVVYPEFRERL